MTRRARIAAGLRTTRARFRALERRDRIRLTAFVVLVAVLATFRLGAADRMHASDVVVPGSTSAQARDLTERAFHTRENYLMVLLQGPARELDRQGPRIAERIARLPQYRVLDPWRAGGSQLRPKPTTAQLLIGVGKPFDDVSRHEATRLRAELERWVRPPVRFHLTGFAEINQALTKESVHAVERGELLAAPILVILLLLIFGSPIAAGMPLFLGGCVALAGAGLLDLVNRFVTPLEVTSITLGTVTALALGVDYSLLLVARFRSELAAGASVREASETAVARAGRTVKFAAAVLCCAMVTALLVTPASVLKSATIGVLVAVVLSVIGAMVALPPLLRWAGEDINRYQLLPSGAESRRWGRLALAAVRRPLVAVVAVMAVILALAAPVASIETGPPDPRVLPADSPARADFEAVVRVLGGGQALPFIATVVAKSGTLADERLAQLARFERELRRDPQTAQALGPATIAARAAQLATVPDRLRRARAALDRGQQGVTQLEGGVGQASRGAHQLADGLAEAERGSAQLHDGHAAAGRGAEQIGDGTSIAVDGAAQLRGGLARARAGLRAFARSSAQASGGTAQLAGSLGATDGDLRTAALGANDLADDLDDAARALGLLKDRTAQAGEEANGALRALDQMDAAVKAEPGFRSAYAEIAAAVATLTGRNPVTGETPPAVTAALEQGATEATLAAVAARGLRDDVDALREGLERLSASAATLDDDVKQVVEDSEGLERRAEDLLAEAGRLEDGLVRESDRSGTLAGGVAGLAAASGRLTGTLGTGVERASPLASALDGVTGDARALGARTGTMARSFGDPDRLVPPFRSGYATIAAIETAPPSQRAAASWAINFDQGGSAVRFLIAPREALPTRADSAYRRRLEQRFARLAREVDATAIVGGPPAQLSDFDQSAKEAMPRLVFMLVLVAYLTLVPLMRSLVLPLIAVALNVLTLLAAFGVLALAFGPDPLLGGPGFVDDIMLMVVFTITFALSLDYAIFILDRMREGYDRSRSVEGAIAYGIDGTAGVLTGAAAIMAGVFVVFALASPVTSLVQVGVGLAVAVLLDATLLRLVLLPAVVRLAGERAWHTPAWLEWLSRPLNRPSRGPAA